MRHASYFKLAYPDLDVKDNYMRIQCTHYVASLYGKLGNEMTGRFNQDLPRNLQAAFEKAANFEPHIITKQNINKRKMNKVHQIDISQCNDDIGINKAQHVRNLNYKGKYYDPNYQENKANKITATIPVTNETTT